MRLALSCLFAAFLMAGCATPGTRPPATAPPPTEAAVEPQVHGSEPPPPLDHRFGPPPVRELPPRQTGALAAESWSPELAAALARYGVAPTPESEVSLAQAYARIGILDKAHEHLSNATRADPKLGEAWDGLARVWREWGFPDIGLGDAYRAVSAMPRSAAAHNTLGTILQLLGHGPEARMRFARAAELDPSAAYAMNNLCYSWLIDGNTVAAVTECRKALAVDPGFQAAGNNLGLARALAGDGTGAVEIFGVARGEASAQFNLGVVYFAQHKYALAAEAFGRAADLQPAFVLARLRAQQARARAAELLPENEEAHDRR